MGKKEPPQNAWDAWNLMKPGNLMERMGCLEPDGTRWNTWDAWNLMERMGLAGWEVVVAHLEWADTCMQCLTHALMQAHRLHSSSHSLSQVPVIFREAMQREGSWREWCGPVREVMPIFARLCPYL